MLNMKKCVRVFAILILVSGYLQGADGDEFWSDLFSYPSGLGLNGSVHHLVSDGSIIYASGKFLVPWLNKNSVSDGNYLEASERSLGPGYEERLILSFDGSFWSEMNYGVYAGDYIEAGDFIDPYVSDMCHDGSNLYVVGWFFRAGDKDCNCFARWDGSDWYYVPSNIWHFDDWYAIWDVTKGSSDVYFSGNYDYRNGEDIWFSGVVGYDGSSTFAVEPDIDDYMGISELGFVGGALYASGNFTEIDGNPINHIARWNGLDEWIALGSGLNDEAVCMTEYDGKLVVGGDFTTAGGNPVNHIAVWDGSTWSTLGTGLNGTVKAMAVYGDDLYIAGSFTQAGGQPANYVAVWDGSVLAWDNLGSGISHITTPNVNAVTVVGEYVYFGGEFLTAGGKPSSYIARWDANGVVAALQYPNFREFPVHNIFSSTIASTLGAAWCDYDNDGDPDILTANDNSEPDKIFNNQAGGFDTSGIPIISGETDNSTGATWGDFNNDGRPDVYLCHLGAPGTLAKNNGNGTFTEVALMNDNLNSFSAAWADYNLDGYLDLFVTVSGGKNRLYRNNGNETFTLITNGAVVNDTGTARNAAWSDYDLDGDPDLYVANTNNEPNFFYKNKGDGTFEKITTGEFVTDTAESWSASWGDYNNDTYPDLFVANNGQANCLYKNNGDGTFTKITSGLIVTDTDHSRSSSWGDMDNDGDLDLFVSNREENSYLYMNKGMGNFDRYIFTNGNFRGASLGDMDLDGDLDMFICQDSEASLLCENTILDNHWLEVQCIGSGSNRSAIGAKVSVQARVKGYLIWQTREISSQTGFGGQNEMIAHFGLHGVELVNAVRIEWPEGGIYEAANLEPDQKLVITEGALPPENREPVAQDDNLSIMQGEGIEIQVLNNDSDPDGDELIITDVEEITGSGTVEIGPTAKRLLFTAAENFSGEEAIDYTISDGKGGLATASVYITVTQATSVKTQTLNPKIYQLYQNSPNPFNPVTEIRYDLPRDSEVELTVFDITGKRIAAIVDSMQPAGAYRAVWNGCDSNGHAVPTGIYFYRIDTGEFRQVRKMLLVR